MPGAVKIGIGVMHALPDPDAYAGPAQHQEGQKAGDFWGNHWLFHLNSSSVGDFIAFYEEFPGKVHAPL
jgi:hypothetical protein